MEQRTENQRIKELRKYLGLTQSKMAEQIGIAQGSYADIERGRNSISTRVLYALREKFNVNPDWLKLGEGEMIELNKERVNKDNFPFCRKTYESLLVKKPKIPGFEDCETIPVYGDQMAPELNSGDTAIIKKSSSDIIEYGSIYLIGLKKTSLLRIIQPGEKDNEVKCISRNAKYPELTIKKNDILNLFLVKGKITRFSI